MRNILYFILLFVAILIYNYNIINNYIINLEYYSLIKELNYSQSIVYRQLPENKLSNIVNIIDNNHIYDNIMIELLKKPYFIGGELFNYDTIKTMNIIACLNNRFQYFIVKSTNDVYIENISHIISAIIFKKTYINEFQHLFINDIKYIDLHNLYNLIENNKELEIYKTVTKYLLNRIYKIENTCNITFKTYIILKYQTIALEFARNRTIYSILYNIFSIYNKIYFER